MTRRASPHVGVGRFHDDVAGIGPVVVQAFPDAARALGDVGLGSATAMHLEIIVGAVTKERGAARPEVGEPGNELFWRRSHRLMEVNRGHTCSLCEGCAFDARDVHQTLVC